MSPAAFAELSIVLHGSVGLYRESRWLSRVRVTNVWFDDRIAGLELETIPTPGLRSDTGEWGVSSIWEYVHASPTHWGQSYPSLRIEFDPDLVAAVVGFAATLPPEYTPDHYPRLLDFMSEFHKARERPVV